MNVSSKLVFVAVAAAAVASRIPAAEPGRELGRSFALDLEEVGAVPAERVGFLEREGLPAQVEAPAGVAVGPDDEVYVVGVREWVRMDLTGKVQARGVLSGAGRCVGVGLDGDVYVGLQDRVVALGVGGAVDRVWQRLGRRAHVTSVAVSDAFVYVADAGNRVVWRFGKNGELLGRIAGRDKARGVLGLQVPSPYCDVGVGIDDSLWVVNPGRHALENYRPNGEPIGSWRKQSAGLEGFCGCCNPTHMAIRNDGGFVTAEKGIVRVKLYGPDGVLRSVVAPPTAFGEGAAELDLAVDGAGRVLVLDPSLGRVRLFEEQQKP